MNKNPYQSPNAEPVETVSPEHRSFRLTPSSPSANDKVAVGTVRDAIFFTFVQQLPLLLLSAMLLDGGLVFRRVAIASVGFWILTLIIVIRRLSNLADLDILLIKWGYLPVLLATCILWAAGSEFMF